MPSRSDSRKMRSCMHMLRREERHNASTAVPPAPPLYGAGPNGSFLRSSRRYSPSAPPAAPPPCNPHGTQFLSMTLFISGTVLVQYTSLPHPLRCAN